MTQIIGIVYILAMLILFIAFLIAWFRSHKQVRGYKKSGVLAGLILIAFEVFYSPFSRARIMAAGAADCPDHRGWIRINSNDGVYDCGHPYVHSAWVP